MRGIIRLWLRLGLGLRGLAHPSTLAQDDPEALEGSGLALSRLSEQPVETRGANNVGRAGALFMKLDLHELCGLVHGHALDDFIEIK